jgi:hypothetical protein
MLFFALLIAPAAHGQQGKLDGLLDRELPSLASTCVVELPPVMASEDFCRFGLEDRQIPICSFWLCAVDPAKPAEGLCTEAPLPGLHPSL